jgi:thiosulfate/3-mercaptopyruvate sulfurtransferase
LVRRNEILLSTKELARLLDDPSVCIADVRFALADPDAGELEYERGHIPGAVYLHWYRDLSDPSDPTPGQLAPPELFRESMEAAGIGDDTLVVAYDDGVIFMAARLAWCLHAYGHHKVRILDGGLPKWRTESRPLATGVTTAPARATFTPRPEMRIRVGKEDVLQTLEAGNAVVLDCRMDETWVDAGAHIPGARRLPAPSLVAAGDGTMLAEEKLVHQAATAGAAPDNRVVLYCGGGVSASLAYFALGLAGYSDLAVYDGSWSEWSADPTTPREPH